MKTNTESAQKRSSKRGTEGGGTKESEPKGGRTKARRAMEMIKSKREKKAPEYRIARVRRGRERTFRRKKGTEEEAKSKARGGQRTTRRRRSARRGE